jgi:hypothetical protein
VPGSGASELTNREGRTDPNLVDFGLVEADVDQVRPKQRNLACLSNPNRRSSNDDAFALVPDVWTKLLRQAWVV